METFNLILPLLRKGMWAATIDLGDAYLHIMVHKDHRRFLTFRYAEQDYQFRALPFGLSTAPRAFTRVAGAVVSYLRRRGVTLYLDDWLVVGSSQSEAADNVHKTLHTLQELGWIVNEKKSRLSPTQTTQFLGAILDFSAGVAQPSEERITAVRTTTQQILSHQESPKVMWLRALGLMASLVDVVRLCRLHMRPLQLHLLKSADPRDPDMTTPIYRSEESTQHLRWWLDPDNWSQGVPFTIELPMTSVTTDASLTGWGAHWSNRTAWGTWSPTERSLHINILEMMAVKRALETFNEHVQGRINHGLHGQHHSGGLHQPAGGHPLREALPTSVGGYNSGRGLRHDPTSFPHCGQAQRDGRRLVQGANRPQRMDAGTGNLQQNLRDLRKADDRPVHNIHKQQAPDLLFQTVPSPGLRLPHGCDVPPMGPPRGLRLPTALHGRAGSQEDTELQGQVYPNSPFLASQTLVRRDSPAPLGRPSKPTGQAPPTVPETGNTLPPGHQGVAISCLETVRSSLRQRGFSGAAAAMAADARRGTTAKTYDSRLRKFEQWCRPRQILLTKASIAQTDEFLLSLFREGKQVSTIKNYRSAIAAIHQGFPDGSTLGNNPDIVQLIKGMANRRPQVRLLASSWGLSAVLHALAGPPYEPMGNASLAALTKKRLFLIAVASARRRSCLHALTTKPNHIRFEGHGVRMVPDPAFIAKHQALTFLPGDIFIPEIKTLSSKAEDKRWCPVRALKWYLSRTEKLRQATFLFILPRPPYTSASKDTLSRWLVETIRLFTTGAARPRAHDIRGVSASTALFAGIPIEDILKAAAWRTPTTFVACYLTDTLHADAAFGSAGQGEVLHSHQTMASGTCERAQNLWIHSAFLENIVKVLVVNQCSSKQA
ncbi:uncharacterized protein [Apostichopus japonicus]|uniref:uncharacterized protein n=1 Tax=Stichopus japonicus TaxID=307972 RepID=UPI003AB325CD